MIEEKLVGSVSHRCHSTYKPPRQNPTAVEWNTREVRSCERIYGPYGYAVLFGRSLTWGYRNSTSLPMGQQILRLLLHCSKTI